MVITVTSYKGGVGKSTAAVHLAGYLSSNSQKALLVDGDLNESADAWNQGRFPFDLVSESRAGSSLMDRYKHTVIDTGARPGVKQLRERVGRSDLTLVPVTPDALSMSALARIADPLEQLGVSWAAFLSIVPPKPSRDGEEARQALEEMKIPLLSAQIPRLVAFQKAALAGVLVRNVSDPRANIAWNACQALGREVLKK